jgi:raffinose/stachyose/melibiose transport system substrate-binding protein
VKLRLASILLCALALAAGCGGTPSSSPSSNAGGGSSSGAVKTSGFEKLGKITLTAWSYDNQDPGLEPVLKELSQKFHEKYPNVTVNLVFKDFNSLVNTVPRALAGDKAPDITEGNQGFQTDAALVRSKLIISLEPYIKAYGWDQWYSPSTWSMFQWSEDGSQFGVGPRWGVAQTGQNVAVFMNTAKLKQLGFDPQNMPKTFDGFDKMLGQIRAKLPSSEPVINFGNKEGYGAIHLFGGIQGAFVPPGDVRDWIYHKQGASYDTPQNVQALDTFARWAKDGFFNPDYNAVGYDTAAANFAKGSGAFWIGGTWDAAIIQSGLKDNVAVMNVPAGSTGQAAAIGATSGPWHISAKTKYPDVAAAWLDYVIASPEAQKLMYEQNQIPAIKSAKAPATSPYLGQITDSWQQLVNDDGLLLYTDWASPTMYQTLASQYQQLLAGRTSAKDMATAVQADWAKFDQTLSK